MVINIINFSVFFALSLIVINQSYTSLIRKPINIFENHMLFSTVEDITESISNKKTNSGSQKENTESFPKNKKTGTRNKKNILSDLDGKPKSTSIKTKHLREMQARITEIIINNVKPALKDKGYSNKQIEDVVKLHVLNMTKTAIAAYEAGLQEGQKQEKVAVKKLNKRITGVEREITRMKKRQDSAIDNNIKSKNRAQSHHRNPLKGFGAGVRLRCTSFVNKGITTTDIYLSKGFFQAVGKVVGEKWPTKLIAIGITGVVGFVVAKATGPDFSTIEDKLGTIVKSTTRTKEGSESSETKPNEIADKPSEIAHKKNAIKRRMAIFHPSVTSMRYPGRFETPRTSPRHEETPKTDFRPRNQGDPFKEIRKVKSINKNR